MANKSQIQDFSLPSVAYVFRGSECLQGEISVPSGEHSEEKGEYN